MVICDSNHCGQVVRGTDRKCHLNAEFGPQDLNKNEKSSELAFAALCLQPSPRYFAKIKSLYLLKRLKCLQAVPAPIAAPVGCALLTASSNEQKLRVPVDQSEPGRPQRSRSPLEDRRAGCAKRVTALVLALRTLSIKQAVVELGVQGATPPRAARVVA